ncbi:alpha/beta hydrolase-fold protein [Intrasporangium sp.]|uniref:alpha/beta hydrolase n=1 Tax=Intrasporangium sp. TaxID=1925024 RepID=UPI003221B5F8
MELTDAGPVAILSAAALLLFVVVVTGRPTLRNRWMRLGGRTVGVLLLNGLVALLTLVILNDQYVFYATWADLFGARSPQVQTQHGGSATAALAAPVHGDGLAGVHVSHPDYALPQPGSRLQTYSVLDPGAHRRVPVLVYLPVGYNPHSARRYPVILGLHGFPATPTSFVRHNFVGTATTLTAEHRLEPSIFVIPQIDVPPEVDTECLNGPPGDPQTDTWLTKVVPVWAIGHLHVRTDRSSWAAFGYSYGGWCSAVLAMRHPDVFGAAVVMVGYFQPMFDPSYEPFTAAQLRAFDLTRMASQNPPPVAMWVLASRQDRRYYPSTAAFVEAARRPLSVTSVVLAQGGHGPATYEPHSAAALTWLAAALPGFRA